VADEDTLRGALVAAWRTRVQKNGSASKARKPAKKSR